jgi:predicted nucleic acid-binding protein
LLFEIANALRYNPSFSTKEIQEALDTLFGIGIGIITPTFSLLSKTVELAEKFDLTCYDASYLALAEDLGFEFITAESIGISGRNGSQYAQPMKDFTEK